MARTRAVAVKNRPAYAIDSVDNALMIATLLQQEGVLRVTDAADRLDISRSTAHRLLSMLVYRDFAVQGEDRRYRPGPVMRPLQTLSGPLISLRHAGIPELRDLALRVGETAHLQGRVGRDARFVASAVSERVPRVDDRTGVVLPAHLAAGGRTLLAAMDPEAVTGLYAAILSPEALQRLHHELAFVRRHGVAVNDQWTEEGVVGVGVLVPADTEPMAAVALAMPVARFSRDRLGDLVVELHRTASRIGTALRAS